MKSDRLLKFARRVAFLGAHLSDRSNGLAMLERELARLYNMVTAIDGDEPDLTFCCGCSEEIDLEGGQEQWVLGGEKYHGTCYSRARELICNEQKMLDQK